MRSPVSSDIRRIIRAIARGSFSSTEENSRSIAPKADSIRASSTGSADAASAAGGESAPPRVIAKAEMSLRIRNAGLSGQRGIVLPCASVLA
jgi:hypothetical protein